MGNLSYRQYMKSVLLAANLKGSKADTVREAMRQAARAWVEYRRLERRVSPSIDEIAKRILG